MIQTVEAVVDASGRVRLLGEVFVVGSCRALVTVLDEPANVPGETALLSEASLAVDWNRPEEDAAWSHLQSAKEYLCNRQHHNRRQANRGDVLRKWPQMNTDQHG